MISKNKYIKAFISKVIKYSPSLLVSLAVIIHISSQKTYYPEQIRKSLIKRILDNLLWLIKYREVNYYYNFYGLDILNSNPDIYLPNIPHYKERGKWNKAGSPTSQIPLLNDKFLFYQYMTGFEMPVAKVFAIIRCNTKECGVKGYQIYDTAFNELNENFLKNKNDYILKITDGLGGDFNYHIKNYNDFSSITKKFEAGKHYILQERLMQCQELEKINPNAINTLRIITIMKNGIPSIFDECTLFRVGTSTSKNVDNAAKGGIVIAVTPNGILKSYGYYEPQFGTKTKQHPDTKVIFAGYNIPMFKEAVELCCRAHRYFYNVHSIGWDVAITPIGPVLLEGNPSWSLCIVQGANHGIKKEWMMNTTA